MYQNTYHVVVLNVSVIYPCFDSAVLIQASGDPKRKLLLLAFLVRFQGSLGMEQMHRNFLSLGFELGNMRGYGCLSLYTVIVGEIEIHMWWKTGQPWSASLLKELSCADFRRLFADVFEMFEGTSRLWGDWSFLPCSWDNPLTKRHARHTYFNFMCCARCD